MLGLGQTISKLNREPLRFVLCVAAPTPASSTTAPYTSRGKRGAHPLNAPSPPPPPPPPCGRCARWQRGGRPERARERVRGIPRHPLSMPAVRRRAALRATIKRRRTTCALLSGCSWRTPCGTTFHRWSVFRVTKPVAAATATPARVLPLCTPFAISSTRGSATASSTMELGHAASCRPK